MVSGDTAPAEMPGRLDIARRLLECSLSETADLDAVWGRLDPDKQRGYLECADAVAALFAPILAEKERGERNRDMWKGQCERQAETLRELRMQMLADEGQSHERG